MARVAADDAVRVEGLAELRRALKKIDRTLDKGVRVALREAGKLVIEGARRNAPHKSGALRNSIKQSVTARRATIYSNLEYAPVHEWGGTIHPHGGAVKIPRREYMNRAVTDSRRVIDAAFDHLLDVIADTWDEH